MPFSDRPLAPELFRVLVVDENPDSIEPLALIFKCGGYDVRSAVDGRHALQLAAEFKPHAAVLDVGMTQLGGIDFARQVRQELRDRNMVLIGLTSFPLPDAEWRKDGFDYTFLKPVECERLVKLLEIIRATVAVRPDALPRLLPKPSAPANKPVPAMVNFGGYD